MKFNKNILPVLILSTVLISNISFAIEETKTNDTNLKNQTAIDINTIKLENEPVEYTNDIHSVFSLEDCIKIAIEYNPEIKAAFYNTQAYKTKIVQAWASYFPKLTAKLNFSRSEDRYSKISASELTTGAINLGYLPQISGEMLLFDFGKTKADADKAGKTYESKKYDLSEIINVLMFNIKVAYYNVLFAQAQVQVYEDTVADYDLQLKRAISFYNTGKKAKVDVITAEYNLGKARLNLVKAKNTLEVANVQLARIMGIPEYTNFELSSQLGTLKYDITQEKAIETAFSVRPDLLSSQKTAEAAQLNLRAKRRNYTPDLGAFASYGNGLGNEYNVSSYQFGVDLKYDSLNMLKVKKEIDEANYTYQQALANYDDKKHTIYLNVKKSYLDLKTAEESIVIAKLALDEAKEQYRQVSGRYKAGVGDYIELKDGETTYLTARLDFYNALLNYNTTAANLEKEIGIPLVTSNINVLGNKIN